MITATEIREAMNDSQVENRQVQMRYELYVFMPDLLTISYRTFPVTGNRAEEIIML